MKCLISIILLISIMFSVPIYKNENRILLMDLTAKADEMVTPNRTIPARPTSFPLNRPKIGNMMISAGYWHTVGLGTNGGAVAVGDKSRGQCNVSSWYDIVEVSAGQNYTVGLKKDGKVIAVGPYEGAYNSGQCKVFTWMDVVAISAGYNHTLGLNMYGTLFASGDNSNGQCNISKWTDIVAVSAGVYHTAGLKKDGTVVATSSLGEKYDFGQSDLSLWTDIAAISAGERHTVGLKTDGTVVASGDNSNGQCNVSDWTDIVAISAGYFHTIGLKKDGTVVAAGSTGNDLDYGQCNVSDWTDIVAVSAGAFHTAGIKRDGTVVAVGCNDHAQCDVKEWQLKTDVIILPKPDNTAKTNLTVPVRPTSFPLSRPEIGNTMVAAGRNYTLGLKSDGTVVFAYCFPLGVEQHGLNYISEWTDIVAVSIGDYHAVGLKSNGTVIAAGVSTGWHLYYQCNVESWTDIVAVSAGSTHTVGLKSDGTVVAVGDNQFGQCEVSQWTDIVAVSATTSRTVGLKLDGTVVAVGRNDSGQCDVSEWTDIVAVSAGSTHTVGLKSDGTVVAVGNNGFGQCNVSEWADIVAIATGSQHTLGVKANGTVVAAGSSAFLTATSMTGPKYMLTFQLEYASKWTDIVAVATYHSHTVGLKKDGTVVAVGNNSTNQCDTKAWQLGIGVNSICIGNPTVSTVIVNGQPVAFDAYNINGNNYFKLRDLAYILSETEKQFEVNYDEAINAILLTKGLPYTVVGGEMQGKGNAAKKSIPTVYKILLDGEGVSFTSYNIEGNNYFKLRDIGAAFDFGVDWDSANNTIVITTSKGYTAD